MIRLIFKQVLRTRLVPLVALAALVALGACSVRDPGGYGLLAYDCPGPEALAERDWDAAKTVTMTVRNGEYTPMVLPLTRDRAYVLRIENRDERDLRFHAPGFFRAVALKGVRVGEGDEDATSCISGLGLPAGETVAARFVPVRDGHYRFEDNALLTTLTGQAFGVIRID